MTFAPKLIKEMDESIEFIMTNLKHQYIIPNRAYGSAEGSYTSDDGIESTFKCSIQVTNLKFLGEKGPADIGTALSDMAQIVVDDNLDTDCYQEGGCFHPDFKHGLPPIYFFRMDYTRTIIKRVEISDCTFEVELTYERKYEKSN